MEMRERRVDSRGARRGRSNEFGRDEVSVDDASLELVMVPDLLEDARLAVLKHINRQDPDP
jgi:hypothetical protein